MVLIDKKALNAPLHTKEKPLSISGRAIKAFIRLLDTDGDGKINVDDLWEATKKTRRIFSRKILEDMAKDAEDTLRFRNYITPDSLVQATSFRRQRVKADVPMEFSVIASTCKSLEIEYSVQWRYLLRKYRRYWELLFHLILPEGFPIYLPSHGSRPRRLKQKGLGTQSLPSLHTPGGGVNSTGSVLTYMDSSAWNEYEFESLDVGESLYSIGEAGTRSPNNPGDDENGAPRSSSPEQTASLASGSRVLDGKGSIVFQLLESGSLEGFHKFGFTPSASYDGEDEEGLGLVSSPFTHYHTRASTSPGQRSRRGSAFAKAKSLLHFAQAGASAGKTGGTRNRSMLTSSSSRGGPGHHGNSVEVLPGKAEEYMNRYQKLGITTATATKGKVRKDEKQVNAAMGVKAGGSSSGTTTTRNTNGKSSAAGRNLKKTSKGDKAKKPRGGSRGPAKGTKEEASDMPFMSMFGGAFEGDSFILTVPAEVDNASQAELQQSPETQGASSNDAAPQVGKEIVSIPSPRQHPSLSSEQQAVEDSILGISGNEDSVYLPEEADIEGQGMESVGLQRSSTQPPLRGQGSLSRISTEPVLHCGFQALDVFHKALDNLSIKSRHYTYDSMVGSAVRPMSKRVKTLAETRAFAREKLKARAAVRFNTSLSDQPGIPKPQTFEDYTKSKSAGAEMSNPSRSKQPSTRPRRGSIAMQALASFPWQGKQDMSASASAAKQSTPSASFGGTSQTLLASRRFKKATQHGASEEGAAATGPGAMVDISQKTDPDMFLGTNNTFSMPSPYSPVHAVGVSAASSTMPAQLPTADSFWVPKENSRKKPVDPKPQFQGSVLSYLRYKRTATAMARRRSVSAILPSGTPGLRSAVTQMPFSKVKGEDPVKLKQEASASRVEMWGEYSTPRTMIVRDV